MDNILVMDVGNTNTAVGVFQGERLAHHWRVTTAKDRTADEMGILIKTLFQDQGLKSERVNGVVVSSVVPPMVSVIEDMCKLYFRCAPLIVGPGIKTGLLVKYENPRDVGADRVANAVAAVHRFGCPVIVVDVRTATTFTVVNQEGHYIGGVIAPGVKSSANALFQQTAKLPSIDLAAPRNVIGKNTVSSMQSGIVYGFAGLIDHLVERICQEVPAPYRVVATGHYARLISPHSSVITDVVPHLTLEGLRILWDLNR
ncbi:type III pantothenate kinase [Alicyclobacillus pomorum]